MECFYFYNNFDWIWCIIICTKDDFMSQVHRVRFKERNITDNFDS